VYFINYFKVQQRTLNLDPDSLQTDQNTASWTFNEWSSKIYCLIESYNQCYVPLSFDADPDLDQQNHVTGLQIQLQIHIWIMLFSSVAFKKPPDFKYFFPKFFCLLWCITKIHINQPFKIKFY
jgi:hypothetical protein